MGSVVLMHTFSSSLHHPIQVFYYSTSLFTSSGLTEESAKFATIGIGCIMVNILCFHLSGTWRCKLHNTVQVVMTLVSIPLMDKTGRRTLHLYGLGGMFIFSIFITISFLIKASKGFQCLDVFISVENLYRHFESKIKKINTFFDAGKIHRFKVKKKNHKLFIASSKVEWMKWRNKKDEKWNCLMFSLYVLMLNFFEIAGEIENKFEVDEGLKRILLNF